MLDSWGRRAAVIAVVLLAVANGMFWGYIYNRQAVKPSAFVAQTHPVAGSSTGTSSSSSALAVAPLQLPPVSAGALRVSIVGDTLATGRYASGPANRFRTLVLTALEGRGPVAPVEAVHNGASTLSTDVTVPGSLNLAVLELGTDDMSRTSPAEFAKQYQSLITAVLASSPRAALICAGTWSANGQAYDTVIQQDCDRANGRYVSLRELYADSANRGPAGVAGYYGVADDQAPNDSGHHAIAAALLRPLGISLP